VLQNDYFLMVLKIDFQDPMDFGVGIDSLKLNPTGRALKPTENTSVTQGKQTRLDG
jgi:hypothetical protein